MFSLDYGVFWFGAVIGWITYRILRRSSSTSVSDIGTVVTALAGGAVLGLLQFGVSGEKVADGASKMVVKTQPIEVLNCYGAGLAAGFFVYFVITWIATRKADALLMKPFSDQEQ